MIGLFLLAAAAPPLPAEAMSVNQAADTTVMGTISLKPNPGDPPSDALDKVNCTDVVVTATDDAGQVVARAPARAGSTKGECIYSLKVPQGKNVLIGLREIKRPASVMMRKAGGEQTAIKYDKRAPIGINQGIILFEGSTAPSRFKAADATMFKGPNASGVMVRRDLNATVFFKAATETK
jgi:hypothetical protein